MTQFFWICLGGALGTGARYLCSTWISSIIPSFPYGTLLVNSAGSFLLAFLMQMGINTSIIPATLRVAATAGFLGGFTTYSTFNYETLRLFQEGSWLLASMNLGVTIFSCLFAGILGFWVGARWS